jgi:hypothetical protein
MPNFFDGVMPLGLPEKINRLKMSGTLMGDHSSPGGDIQLDQFSSWRRSLVFPVQPIGFYACTLIGKPASLLRRRAPITPHEDTMPE